MESDTPPQRTDEELARQSLGGALAAFEALVERYEAPVYRFICQRCRNPDDARDITQTVFVSAFRNLRQFKPGRSFRGWVYAIARNRTIDFLRSRRACEPLEPERLVDVGDPASTLEQHEQVDGVWASAREQLSNDQYETLWLRYQEELSLREIALATGRTETGVKVTLFRARQKLAAHLGRSNDSIRPPEGALGSPALAEARSLVRVHRPPLMTS